jgi:Metallo-peptidase family M12B Reprolysin-like/FlgD Ig-like domain
MKYGKLTGPLLAALVLMAGAAVWAADTPPLPPGFQNDPDPTVRVRSSAPDPMWTDLGSSSSANITASSDRVNKPRSYRVLHLDYAAMTAKLATAPQEKVAGVKQGVVITLPMPDGTFQRFHAVQSHFLGEQVQALIPDFRSYIAKGLDDRSAVLHLDTGQLGFRAYGRTASGTLWIDPWQLGETENYISAWKHDFVLPDDALDCGFEGSSLKIDDPSTKSVPVSGDFLYTYRMAMTLTGEYTVFFGGQSPAIAQAATTINRINQVYEIDAAVRFNFTNVLAYVDPATDPFPTGSSITGSILSQNQTTQDALVGSANYDIGHILTQGSGGGLASLGVVCSVFKARGGTGRTTPTGDPFDIDYVAHEVGHQMGGNHTFNGSTGSCAGGNRSPANAYEPGSGSTIMAYAGICGAENVQLNSDPYFHVRSLEEIIAVRNATGCAVTTVTGNTPPVADAGPDWTIPRGTAFWLVGNAVDPDGDVLSYCWEQYDLGNPSPPTDPYGPLFRSLSPSNAGFKYFPDVDQVFAGSSDPFEVSPTVDRSLTMRMTVRDNAAGGGGVDDDEIELTVAGAPFQVTAPNGGESFAAGEPVTVTWDVGGSIATTVVIWLYSSAGFAVLADQTPNDGNEAVTMPCGVTATNCRIWIEERRTEYLGVHVFDVSNADFTLTEGLPDYTPYSTWDDTILINSVASTTSPTSLIGDGLSFMYWGLANLGAAWPCATVQATASIDEVVVNTANLGTAPGHWNSWGPAVRIVSGGRHTVWQEIDAAGAQAELDETNNGYARQWVWQPSELPLHTSVIRSQPPERNSGSAYIPSGVSFYGNWDGVRVTDDGNIWQAVAVSSLNYSDYDLALFAPSSGPEDGFVSPLASSNRGGPETDFVISHRFQGPLMSYDVGVLSYDGTGDYVVDRRTAGGGIPIGGQDLGVPVVQNQIISLKQFDVDPGQEGRYVVEIDNAPTTQTLDVLLFASDVGVVGRGSAIDFASVDGFGSAFIDHDFTVAGEYILAVVRKASEGLGPFAYDVKFRPTPPDIATTVLAGSHGPVVPQIDLPITVGDPVPAPASLEGDAGSTVFYFHIANNGPADANLWDLSAIVDGITLASVEWPFGLPGGTTDITSSVVAGFYVRGGRHTSGLFFDSADEFDELYEDNNRHAEQWVWTPTQLALGETISRVAPPDPVGGWDDIPVGLTRELNVDGLRTPAFAISGSNGYVSGWAATPNPGSDIDLRVHAASTGAQDGFDALLETSSLAGNATEFVLFDVDGPLPGGEAFDIGVEKISGESGYQAHAAESLYLSYTFGGSPAQVFGPFTLDAGELLAVYEFSTGSLDVPLNILVKNDSGNADLALAVFDRSDAGGFLTPLEAMPGGFADDGGAGANERVELVLAPGQFWAVAVYKTNGAEIGKSAGFSLHLSDQVAVPVPDAAPLLARIANYPNPFNPQTRIDFVLEQAGRASVRIYDVQGRLVRTLVDGDLAAGAHTRQWRGLNDHGSEVASGVYLALFEHPTGSMRQRMVLLK